MPRVAQGGRETLRGNVGRANGFPADAPDLTLTVLTADGDVVAGFPVAIPDIVRDDLGLYHYDWNVPVNLPVSEVVGDYTATWEGTVDDAPAGGSESIEVVEPGEIDAGPFDILLASDYGAIRHLLGVTPIDVGDEIIESMPFGPHAELMVKLEVEDWEEVPSLDPRRMLLRLAAVYGTAALIAESNANGGFLGLVRGEGSRTAAEWTDIARLFWSYFHQLLDQSEEPAEDLFIYPWLMVARPRHPRSRPWDFIAQQMYEGGF